MFNLFVGWQIFLFLGILFGMTSWTSIKCYKKSKHKILILIAAINIIFTLACIAITFGVLISYG